LPADTITAPPSPPPELTPPAALATDGAPVHGRFRLTRGVAFGAVGALMLVSVWLRLRGLHFHFWIDEGLSVGISSHPLSQIPSLLRQDGSPPLYYLMLHVWMSIFGRTEAATHELSLVFALLTIPVAYWAGTSLFDRRVGLVGALLAATVPYLTTYGEETRMYALLALLSLIACTSFVHTFVFRRRRYLPVFVISLTASLYTHNWALFFALMAAVAFLVCVRRSPADERRGLWRDGLIALGSIFVLFAPWLPTLAYQARHTGAPWDTPPDVWSLTQGGYSLVNGRGAAVALLLGGGAGLLALRRPGAERGQIRLAAECLLILALGTVLIAWAYSKVTPAWADRYLAVVVGPLIVLFGLGLTRAGRLGMVALALAVCFWILDPFPSSLSNKSNVAAAVAALRPQMGTPTLVLSTQPEQVPTLHYYLPGVKRFGTPLGVVPDAGVVDWRNALAKLRASSVPTVLMPMLRSLSPGDRVLLVVPTDLASSPQWLNLITKDDALWLSALLHDHSLRRVASSAAGASSSTLVQVRGTLFEVR
jgi:mannosyltransferase